MAWWLIKTVIASLGIIIIGHHIYKFLLGRLTTTQTQNFVLRDSIVVAQEITETESAETEVVQPVTDRTVQPDGKDAMCDELTSFLLDKKLNNNVGETS